MSCRCITPFSLLNAYTELIGRSSVSIVSLFKHGKGYRWWSCPTTNTGNEACSRAALLHDMKISPRPSKPHAPAQMNSDLHQWQLPQPSLFFDPFLDQAVQHSLPSVWGFPLCPAHPAGALPCCATSEPLGSSSFTFLCYAHCKCFLERQLWSPAGTHITGNLHPVQREQGHVAEKMRGRDSLPVNNQFFPKTSNCQKTKDQITRVELHLTYPA